MRNYCSDFSNAKNKIKEKRKIILLSTNHSINKKTSTGNTTNLESKRTSINITEDDSLQEKKI